MRKPLFGRNREGDISKVGKAATVEIGYRKSIKCLGQAFKACLSNMGPMEAKNGRGIGLGWALSWHLEFGFHWADKYES